MLSQAAVTTSSLEDRVLIGTDVDTDGSGVQGSLLEAFAVTRAVEADIATIKVSSDICKFPLQLRQALT